MNSLWNDVEAKEYEDQSPLGLRVYTSRLLGQESSLVLHGGGNTSVKLKEKNIFNEEEELLYVKGSGWDLSTIEKEGFAPVKLSVLLQMAQLETLDDEAMVRVQRTAMTNPTAPNPSVEAILHATIPFKYVDHTHADVVVTITNTEGGEERIKEIYGDRLLIIPYVMPGFVLARKIYEMTQGIDWSKIEGMVLLNHGIFTFADDAKECYEKMIQHVSAAEAYLAKQKVEINIGKGSAKENLLGLAQLRKAVSQKSGVPMIASLDQGEKALSFSCLENVASIATRGPITPDHVIRTKQIPLIVKEDIPQSIESYDRAYLEYFKRNTDGNLTCLDTAPRWAVWPGHGVVSFGETKKAAQIVSDIKDHTLDAIEVGEALGGWKPLDEKDLFEVEYWVLEQAKLKKAKSKKTFTGKVVLVTGAASGIGYAAAERFKEEGAAVIALDINPAITKLFQNDSSVLALQCDATNETQLTQSLEEGIRQFGGLDVLVSNVGIFPQSKSILETSDEVWENSLQINLSSHQRLLKKCIPYLQNGIDPAIIIIASKNVQAPGPGASAYSVAKAGLTQLARVAALELGGDGIRVNVIHPNQVFDTALWTDEILTQRAKEYGLSVQEYKRYNTLKVEITSKDVARMISTVAGSAFSKTTGAQIAIDGGNNRVI